MTARSPDGHRPASVPPLDPEATVVLLEQVKNGDEAALNRLLERCLPPLRRWAHGRLPSYCRDLLETADVVQETVIKALKHLDHLEVRREGALQAYLRTVLNNHINDTIRYRLRRPHATPIPEGLHDPGASPLELAVGSENAERYEAALGRLSAEDREAIIARLELQYDYEELAVALDKPTPDAARQAVLRAMKRLAAEIRKS